MNADVADDSGPPTRTVRWSKKKGVRAACTVLVLGLALSTGAGLLWRAREQSQERSAFRATASDVTQTLGTLLRRDTDFAATLRALFTMHPNLTTTSFQEWFAQLEGRQREAGSLGTVALISVPRAQLRSFQVRRNADPAYRALVEGKPTLLAPVSKRSRYCLLDAGIALVRSHGVGGLLQRDWCQATTPVLGAGAPLLTTQADTGRLFTAVVHAQGLDTVFLQAAFYRRGAALTSAAERRGAAVGWVSTSFDIRTVIELAIGRNAGLGVELLHTNPGQVPTTLSHVGPAGNSDALDLTTTVPIDGTWTVKIHGAPVVRGFSADARGGLVFAAGAVISILITLLILVLSRSREAALRLVEETTGELRHQTLHDPLTGLPNRALALDRAEQMLARARRTRGAVAALYVDIDGFKHVNDTFGHPAGDRFLEIVASRLTAVTRDSDTAARLAGDEFVVLLEVSSLLAAPEFVAGRLLELLSEPYDLGEDVGHRVSLSASIGIAYGTDGGAEALLADADLALYAAKASGKARYALFESAMEAAAQDRRVLEMELTEALAAGQLFLLYQPVFELRTRRVRAIEALLRWRHPTRGVLAPEEFLSVAEGSGLIVPIGRWVLGEACRQAAAWQAQGHKLGVGVNVAAQQLERDELVADVRRALNVSGLDPESLTLEVTETAVVRDPAESERRLAVLKQLGVRIAIDDFGTGASPFAYLRRFPVDSLKIDPSLVEGLADSQESAAMLHMLVELGRAFNLDTLAQGIESPAQLEILQHEHCDYGQGFLFAGPLDPESVERLLAEADAHTLTPR
jgi:diguanylate cyclase (GGDEF)-like protein